MENKGLISLCLASNKHSNRPDKSASLAERHGCDLVAHIDGKGLGVADALIYENEKNIVVVFQGTEAKAKEWRTVLSSGRHYIGSEENPNLWVHRGFQRILQERCHHKDSNTPFVEAVSTTALHKAKESGKRVIFTGHSLGGALACMTIEHLGRASENKELLQHIDKVVTFAAPRPGGKEWKGSFLKASEKISCEAFALTRDVVPKVAIGAIGYVDPIPVKKIPSKDNWALVMANHSTLRYRTGLQHASTPQERDYSPWRATEALLQPIADSLSYCVRAMLALATGQFFAEINHIKKDIQDDANTWLRCMMDTAAKRNIEQRKV